MNIWIDLANSPHVIFFVPLIKRLQKEGHTIYVTMRDFAQTVPLAHSYGIKGDVIGRHGGASRLLKVANLFKRTNQLIDFSKDKAIDVVVSHNSYTHTIAGRLIGARVVTIMDYEGQPANHLAFRAAHKVIVPECFPETSLNHFGARNKTHKYSGFKEQLYLSDFKPDQSFPQKLLSSCGIDEQTDLENKIFVTIRTPPTMALYHHFQNIIFEKLLENLNLNKDLLVIILPRNADQGNHVKANYKNLHVPSQALDGMNLTYYSDLVISAGGTMNREAAVMGTPAYSIFLGSMPAVDTELIKLGRMFHIINEDQLHLIRFVKKRLKGILINHNIINEITNEILT